MIVLQVAEDASSSFRFQAVKGWLFVALSGAFIYWLSHLTRHRWFTSNARLLEAQREFETAERVAGVGHWVLDPATADLRWSAEMFHIFGVPRHDKPISFEEASRFIHPDDRESVDAMRTAFETNGGTFSHAHRIIQSSGAVRWVQLRGERVETHDGRTRVTGTVHDITELKLAEIELRRAHEQLDELATHLASAREEERQRLAMDIHDVVGAGLAGIRMSLTLLNEDLTRCEPAARARPAARVGTIEHDLDSIIRTVRHLAADLRPAALDELGLVPALEVLVEEWGARSDCIVEVVGDPDVDVALEPARAIHVYRVVQEALTNVTRHARASRVRLSWTVTDRRLDLVIADNGRGMPTGRSTRRGFGLANMRQRASIVGATLSIDQANGGGTSVRLSVPIAEAPEPVPEAAS